MIRYTLANAALIAVSIGIIHAEEIHWEALYVKFGGACAPGPGGTCGDGSSKEGSIEVFTRDGRKHHANVLCIAPDKLRLDCGEEKDALASGDVVRIVIRKASRFLWHSVAIAELPLLGAFDACGVDVVSGGGHCNPFKFAARLTLLSPIWAYCAASAPVTLSIDAVNRMIPPKKFEVVP